MRFSTRRLALAAGGAALLIIGMGSTAEAQSRSRRRITAEELGTVQVSNVLDAIRTLRPDWLQPRGSRAGGMTTMPGVIMDNTPISQNDVSHLATVPLETIEELRYLSASDATTRWGTGYVGGAIQVITKR
jgi:hypothetical protein